MNDNENAEAADDTPFISKPKRELVKPPLPTVVEQPKSVQATVERVFDQRMKGLGDPPAAGPAAPNLASDVQILNAAATYLKNLDAAAANLNTDVTAIQPMIDVAAPGGVAATAALGDIQNVSKAIYSSNTGMSPATLSALIATAAADLAALQVTRSSDEGVINGLNIDNAAQIAHINVLNGQIAALQAQVASLAGGSSMVPAPTPTAPAPTNPTTSNTTMFLVGTAAVLGIAGTVWYLSKNRPSKSPMPRRLPSRV